MRKKNLTLWNVEPNRNAFIELFFLQLNHGEGLWAEIYLFNSLDGIMASDPLL